MERSDMRTMVRTVAQVTTNIISDAELDVYFDEGYDDILGRQEWSWCYAATPDSISCVSGTKSYAVAATVKRILSVINVDQDYDLESIGPADWARRQAALTSQSRPTHYCFLDGNLLLWPTPAVTDDLEVYSYEHPTFASGDTAEPAFDETFHTLIVNWGLHRVWEQEEDFEKSSEYRARYETQLSRMTSFYNTQVRDMPKIYGQRGQTARSSPMPWLGDANLGGYV